MASTALNELFKAAVDFAQSMLAKESEFIPFGVSLDTEERIGLVAGDVGSEHPASSDVIALLESSFKQSASEGSILAAGVCLDVRVVPPNAADKSDAICVRLAHVSGEALEVFMPYAIEQAGSPTYGPTFATQAGAFRL